MSDPVRRRFTQEFKLSVIEPLESGERGTALAPELSIKRTIIYWGCELRDDANLSWHPGPNAVISAAFAHELLGGLGRAQNWSSTKRP